MTGTSTLPGWGTPAAAEAPLQALFEPRGVAVVGMSRGQGKMGSVMARSLASFPGPVVLVNERGPDVAAGLYPSVGSGAEALGAAVDLAVLCLPAAVCAGALERAASAGVGAALVCAGGFAEAGADGVRAQEALVDVARRHGVRLLGPNTSGFLAPGRSLYATFVPGALDVRAGSVGVVAASGGVNHALAFLLARSGHGVSVAVGLGNAVDVGVADVLDHLAADAGTRAIALHVESVSDGARLVEAVRRASAIKPVVALVVGRADVADFARSHTGALATGWRTTRAVLEQAGAVLVDNERELVDAVGALSATRLPASHDPGVAVVTAQAGPGLLVLDELRQHGVRVPELAAATQLELAGLLPALTYQANPVDTGRPAESFSEVLVAVSADPQIDLVAVYALSEPGVVDLADALRRGTAGPVPAVVAVGGVDAEVLPVRDQLIDHGIGFFPDPAGLAMGVRALVSDARGRRRLQDGTRVALPAGVCDRLARTGEWTEAEAKNLLDELGLRTPRRAVCESEQEAARALGRLSRPVAVKLLDATVLHKTEVGGVHLDIATNDQLDQALTRLRAVGATRFLVEEMAPAGVDLILGARRDAVFGPIVMVGLGGVVAEALADVALRRAPLTIEEARSMPGELRGREILYGWRGGVAVDPDELARAICLLGQVLVDEPGLDEIEINPLRITRHGLVALDAVVTTRSSDGQPGAAS